MDLVSLVSYASMDERARSLLNLKPLTTPINSLDDLKLVALTAVHNSNLHGRPMRLVTFNRILHAKIKPFKITASTLASMLVADGVLQSIDHNSCQLLVTNQYRVDQQGVWLSMYGDKPDELGRLESEFLNKAK